MRSAVADVLGLTASERKSNGIPLASQGIWSWLPGLQDCGIERDRAGLSAPFFQSARWFRVAITEFFPVDYGGNL